MQGIWKKLNLKDHEQIALVNAPDSFESHVDELEGVSVLREVSGKPAVSFILAFVTSRGEIQNITSKIIAKTTGDVIVWFCYPKGISKKYSCNFNRDTGWESLFELGFGGVRQVAIDEDWSALRFRRNEFVKSKKK